MQCINKLYLYLLCSMYRPPSASHDYYDKMIENIELVSMLNKEIVIFGDLNFNYKLDEFLSSNPVHLIENLFQLSQIVTEPTRKTLTSSTLLDVILTSVPEKHLESRVLTTAFSDHYSVFTVIDTIKQKYMETTNALDSETLNSLTNKHLLMIFYIVKLWKMSCLRLMFLRDGTCGKMNS